jgi:hypothetical protein
MRIYIGMIVLTLIGFPGGAAQMKASAPEQRAAVDNVLCCCRIHGGGQCCAEVAFCSGGFVPGCFCSNFDSASDLLDND